VIDELAAGVVSLSTIWSVVESTKLKSAVAAWVVGAGANTE
jgi:hypothetical protein